MKISGTNLIFKKKNSCSLMHIGPRQGGQNNRRLQLRGEYNDEQDQIQMDQGGHGVLRRRQQGDFNIFLKRKEFIKTLNLSF